jgi:nucleoside-diphosphate-sugar epimerase
VTRPHQAQRVWVTGATGYLGGAIADRLVRAGHEVRFLVRDEARAGALEVSGFKAVVGDLGHPESYVSELKNCDAVVHVAIDDAGPAAPDQALLEVVRTAAQDGRVRRLLYTSGVWVHGDTGGAVVDETEPLAAAEVVRWRPAHEEAALDLSHCEVAAVILRPGMVYGERRGTFGEWFAEAKERGTVTYPGDGAQHWGTVHREDVAEAYALALEHARGGERYLLVDGSRHTVRELAAAVAAAAGAPAVAGDREEVLRARGSMGAALLMDQQFTAARARRELGWVPRHASVVTEAKALLREWRAAMQQVG